MRGVVRLFVMSISISSLSMSSASWSASHRQSLEFSFPVTEQKKFHSALMRVWSGLYWATVDQQHKQLFFKTMDDFVHHVLYLNTFLDLFLVSYKKREAECGECVVNIKEDMEHFSSIVGQSRVSCAKLQKNNDDSSLHHACYVLDFIHDKMDDCVNGNGSLIDPLF